MTVLAMVVFAVVARPGMAADTAKPVRLFAEAEDFEIVSGDWDVVPYRENYFASTFAMTFLSRMACLGAPEQTPADAPAVAEQAIVIPTPGDYDVLARYEQPYDFSAEFTVEVEQNGNVVYSKVYGRLDDEKIWGCMGTPENRRTPMARFFWGGTDNIVWQHFEKVTLQAGDATLRLIAGPQMDGDQPRRQAARRHVDLIMLTNDEQGREAQKNYRLSRTYLEMDGWLVQDGDFFVRFTNPADAPASVTPLLEPVPRNFLHSPYAVHLRDWPRQLTIYRNGYEQTAIDYQNAGPRTLAVADQYRATRLSDDDERHAIEHGQSSGWVPVGHLIDALHVCKWNLTVPHTMQVAFARPDGKGGLQVIREMTLSGQTRFELPGVIAPNPALEAYLEDVGRPAVVQTVEERMQWLIDEVKAFPAKGRRPERLLIYKIMGWGGADRDDGRELGLLLGDNTTYDEGNRRGLITHWRNPDPEVLAGQIESHGNFEDIKIVSYGDEHHVPLRRPTEAEFADFLKQHAPEYDGPAEWTNRQDDPLLYYSQLAAFHKGAAEFAAGTTFLGEEHDVLTGVNYSPHGNYLVTEHNYIRAFKMKALSMPWSEDYIWQIPEFSVQVMGYLTTAFRAGAKYHDMPIHMYVMPHSPGNTPRNFRLSFYTAVAHGSTMINYFCASPLAVASTENYVATDDIPMWRAIHDCTHETGRFEDYVMDGRVRPARVGLVLSSVDDFKSQASNARLAVHNNERKAIYYALRHAQVPVDMLSEDDVIDGYADEYDVIYLTQRWAHSRFIKALERWVERGGTLVALAGGGFMDEFNRPNPRAAALYGVATQELREDPNLLDIIRHPNATFQSKQDLPRYEPFDAVSWTLDDVRRDDVGVMIWRQTLTVDDGEVLGVYRDGSPAVVAKQHGRGRAVLFGFLPGQAYLKSGLPLRPVDRGATDAAFTHYLPTTMDRGLRDALVDAFLPETFERPVVSSVDLVESSVIDTFETSQRRFLPGRTRPRQTRMAVPLMNYTGEPIPDMTLEIRDIDRVNAVHSVEHGELAHELQDGSLVIRMPLDVTDMLLIDF